MISVRDHMVLRLAATPYHRPGNKVTAMHEITGYSETRFWARVAHLIALPEVEAAYPMQVSRQKRLRELRQRHRSRVA